MTISVHLGVASGHRDTVVGVLHPHRRRDTESASFAYDTDYLATPGSYALDPALPLRSGSQHTPVNQALFGAFRDCAPDRWGRTLLKRREHALAKVEHRTARSLSEVDYTLGVRDHLRQGALRFSQDGGRTYEASDDVGVPGLTDLPELLALAARAENDTADLDDLHRLIRVGSSLGGARPKAHVRAEDGRLAIAKFPSASHDTWDVMAWEKVALDLAEAASIDVPRSQLLDLAGRSVLVLDRFDRTSDGSRIGYVSAMTMLEATDGDQRSYLEIAETIEETSAEASVELEQLWRRIVFSVLISNTDDHLRNHGFLHQHGDVWRLSPAFDLNPNPAPGPKYLSTSIGAGDDSARVEAALAVADYFRLTSEAAQRILDEVTGVVRGWRSVAASHGLGDRDQAGMAPAFIVEE